MSLEEELRSLSQGMVEAEDEAEVMTPSDERR